VKITKDTLKQLIKEELTALQDLGLDPLEPEREDIFTALGLDEQALVEWANTYADEESGPWSRVQVIDPPDKRPDGALELVFQFLP
tara:strand:- start:1298 stop:1555 length:258 start_codon:yes stop_codon:yes gene_type:complete